MKRKTSFFCTVILLSIINVFAQEKCDSCEIVIVSNPPEFLGNVIGAGSYPCGTFFSICAFPPNGWEFVNWTIDSIVVSTDLCFAFAVTNSCTLVANFIKTTDVINITENSAINIYPNPAFSTVTIEANNFSIAEVYNIFGQLLQIATTNKIDVSSYNSGIYFFKLFDTENNSVTKQVIVVR